MLPKSHLLAVTSCFLLLLLAPMAAKSKMVSTYEFKEGSINAEWQGLGDIQITKQPTGIVLVSGTSTGVFLTKTEPSPLVEGAYVYATAEENQNVRFVWIYSDSQDVSYSMPFTVKAGVGGESVIPLVQHRSWREGTKQLGLVLPPNTAILLHRIHMVKWNGFEKVVNAVLSFWELDQFRPYSINFAWGPLAVFTPAERAHLYNNIPPIAYPAVKALNIALLLLVAGFALFGIWKKKDKNWRTRKILATVAVFWLLLDLRMGAEFLRSVWIDHTEFIAAPKNERVFRDRDNFYDFASFAIPLLHDRTSYVFFAQMPWPYLGNMRYLTYPTLPSNNIAADDTWVIYDRPDMSVNEQGLLVIGGEAVAGPGVVLGRFDEKSFVYRVQKPPSALQFEQ